MKTLEVAKEMFNNCHIFTTSIVILSAFTASLVTLSSRISNIRVVTSYLTLTSVSRINATRSLVSLQRKGEELYLSVHKSISIMDLGVQSSSAGTLIGDTVNMPLFRRPMKL